MAKLPKYEQSASLMAGIDTIQTPNVQESIRRSQSIQGGLDVLTQFASSQAERAVVKEAMQYTIDNPLTGAQLEEARVKGINPIESALNGGLKWNDAVRKLYAQQASAELTNEAYKHYESVYDRVKKGELQDEAVIRQELETPLKSWSNVVSQIDPEEGIAFYKRRITDGNSYYKASLTDVSKKEQLRQDKISHETFLGMVKQFGIDVQNQEPGIVLQKYLDGQEEAKQLFANSASRKTFENEIEREFTSALFRHMSKQFQGEYGSSEEVLAAMMDGKLGKYSEIYNDLTPTQKDKLESYVKSDFAQIDSANKSAYQSVKSQATTLEKQLLSNIDPESTGFLSGYSDFLMKANNVGGSLGAAAKAEAERVKLYVEMSMRYKNLPLSAIESDIAKRRASGLYPESVMQEHDNYYDKLKTQYDADPTAFILRRNNQPQMEVEILTTPNGQLTEGSFDEQLSSLKSSTNYVPGITPVLTETQVERLADIINSPATSIDQKVDIARNIVTAFDSDAMTVFKQLDKKDQIFAHLGSLAVDGTSPTVLKSIMQGQQIAKDTGIDISKKSNKSKVAVQLSKSLSNHPGEAARIIAAADAYYIGAGGNTEIFNEKDYTKAIQAVMGYDGEKGGIVEISGNLVPIQSDLQVDKFRDYWEKATLEDFKQAVVYDIGETPSLVGMNGEEYSIDDLERAIPKRVGDYYMLVDTDNNPFMNEGGFPILFDVYTLKELHETKQLPQYKGGLTGGGITYERTGFSSFRRVTPEEAKKKIAK